MILLLRGFFYVSSINTENGYKNRAFIEIKVGKALKDESHTESDGENNQNFLINKCHRQSN